MSNIFKRPMFRKGGDVGGGIMNNVVERGQYAESNAKDFTTLKDRIDFIEGLGGKTGLRSFNKFLLELGPNSWSNRWRNYRKYTLHRKNLQLIY